MKYCVKIIACLIFITLLCTAVCSCRKNTDSNDNSLQADLDYSDINPMEYIENTTYIGLTVTLDSTDQSREDALWGAILENTNITSYPEEKVEYYFQQEKAYYMYLVKNDEKDYQALLSLRGVSEEEMREDARRMVAKDLIYRFVVDAENIALTEDEKTQLFDRYAEKYVADYGYTKGYVTENMSDMVYQTMLYDKTMEYLILKNTFIIPNE